jgi:hypothetical protein
MADVRVFVDDAVQGRLPAVCAKTGQPCDGWLTLTSTVARYGGIGTAWLLLLLLIGPIGWAMLLVIALLGPGRGEERLTVELPWSTAAQQRVQALRRQTWLAGSVTALVSAGLVAYGWLGGATGPPTGRTVVVLAAVGIGGGIVASLVAGWRAARATVGVELDASRRWVTLRLVHPAFAAAVRAQQARDRPASRA